MTFRTAQQREELIASIRALAEEGYSSQQVAEKLGLDIGPVRGLAKRADPPVQFRSRPGKPPAPLHVDPTKSESFKRKYTAHAFGRTCCWAGCKNEPAGHGKPYCEQHAREARYA